MSRVPNCSKAQQFQMHDAGGPYAFEIEAVSDFSSKNNDSPYPDKYQMDLKAIGTESNGHCDMRIWVYRSERSYMLRRICEAVGLSPEGGYDSQEFIGKTFQAEVGHSPDGKYANLKSETIESLRNDAGDADDDLPF